MDDKKTKTAQFTPGPWALESETRPGGTERYVTTADGGVSISWTPTREFGPSSEEEKDANARLIAQAPAMYALLTRAVSFEPDDADLIADMKACLAAVEGK